MTTTDQRLRCALVGADSLLVECGEALLAAGHEVTVVAAGTPKVGEWARSKDLAWFDASGPTAEWEQQLSRHSFDWLLAITHLKLLPDSVLSIPERGSVNFHDGLLPAYGGLNAPVWALIDGAPTYGITWHLVTAGIDEGDVLVERRFDVADEETSLSLNTRNFEAAIDSFQELIDLLVSGDVTGRPQDTSIQRRTFSRHDRPDAFGILDFSRPAAELDRLVRALSFGPYPNTVCTPKLVVGDLSSSDGTVTVVSAEVRDVAGVSGTIISSDPDAVVVACGEGALAITAVATARGGALDLTQAIEAHDLRPGRVLSSLDPRTSEALVSLAAQAARAESLYERQLHSLEPVELPWARTPTADHVARHERTALDVPDGLAVDAVVGAWATLLSRLVGKDRFHLAVSDAVWAGALGATAGLFARSAPVEISIDPTESLAGAVSGVADRLAAARGRLPFAQELIARHPDLTRNPDLAAGRLLPVAVRFGEGDTADEVVAELVEGATGWSVVLDTGLVDAADGALLVSCLKAVLEELASDPTRPVGHVDLLGTELRHRILEDWNATDRPVPATTVHQLIEATADTSPDVTAVVFEDRSITYRELDERANRLAHSLIDLGVGPDDLVGVHVTRGIDLVVAVLGVHKAGGAYVPLDPVYPANRLEHMINDSGCEVVLTQSAQRDTLPLDVSEHITVVSLDEDRELIASRPTTRPMVDVSPSNLAYCIYTSGSTGLPKGVLIEHGNVVNFFEGMDERVAHELPATWFAVTSLSFDISVLELLYTLARGFSVVVYLDRDRHDDEDDEDQGIFVEQHPQLPMDFSLFYFSGDASTGAGSDRYRLLLDGARFADRHDFTAVWTPERHFHDFGGLYPQPAVTSAAIATITERVKIRSGSVVMPLEHPIRVAEAWSVVDNLSDGRVGISVASGWQPNDFVLRPQNYKDAKAKMFEGLDQLRRLWRGETVTFIGVDGAEVPVRTLPRPVQEEVPAWVTTAGNPDTYVQAGRVGANVLTHLLGQSIEQLAPKIEAYRQARAEAGFDPDAGIVSLMLHTFVGEDEDVVREKVRGPLKDYLGTSASLLRDYAWSFPAFQRPGGAAPRTADDLNDDVFHDLGDDEMDAVLEFAFLRYYETSGLFGTPERCRETVDKLKGIGVDEIACLIDFGIDTDEVLDSLPLLDRIRRESNAGAGAQADPEAQPAALDQSVASQLTRHGVTHMQCTPSMARMLSMQEESRDALASVEHLFVGGEAFPVALADELRTRSLSGKVTNMYGPTETTIWSTTWPLHGDLNIIPIGTPIANTRIYILDRNHQPVPPGVAGELWIGGLGVVRGYHERPELTAERFVADPFRGGDHRMYLTGDLARWREQADGSGLLEFLGRIDHQVKIRGYRIELGEIEAQLGRCPGVRECVAAVREDSPGDQQLVAYASASAGATLDAAELKDRLRSVLPDVMVPGHLVLLADLPHTPNGKIDRNALPSLGDLARRDSASPAAEASNETERLVLSVWEETLGRSGIGIDDNFFDIGGHSLLIVRMHRRLKELLERPIALTELYRHPTVRSFSDSLSGDGGASLRQASADRAARRRENLQRRRVRSS